MERTDHSKTRHIRDSGSDGESRQDLIDRVCEFARTNPALAEGAATLLGFPGVGAAASVLCSLGN
jgi:hypothetical protein